MDNTINNVSFKANIKTFTKIKNKAAFTEVKQLFENSTKNDTKDVLYISDAFIGGNKLDVGNTHNAVYIPNINKQLETMSENELADKLVKIFEALKSHTKVYEKNEQLESELNRAKALFNLNSRISRACSSSEIAKRYNGLAERNKARFDALTKEITNRLNNFNKKIDKLSEQYEELSDLKFNI